MLEKDFQVQEMSDEELMDMVGGCFGKYRKPNVIAPLYGIVPTDDVIVLKYGVRPLYGIEPQEMSSINSITLE